MARGMGAQCATVLGVSPPSALSLPLVCQAAAWSTDLRVAGSSHTQHRTQDRSQSPSSSHLPGKCRQGNQPHLGTFHDSITGTTNWSAQSQTLC